MMDDRTLLLVGAGHAHLGVIDSLRKNPLPRTRVVLVEPLDTMRYSGMVPGWLAGEYRADEAGIPLQPLVAQSGIDWRRARLVSLDPHAKAALLDSGEIVNYDVCAIATGGEGQAAELLGSDPRLLDIRPIDGFIEHWRKLRDSSSAIRNIAVVGGGAGGVELAFGLANAREKPRFSITLVCGEGGLLTSHSGRIAEKVRAELVRQEIRIVDADARFESGKLVAGGKSLEALDLVVAAVGSGAPDWPRASGLPVDEDGFIRVDEHQAVCGFREIFATGDVARRTDRHLKHSGVHAVYAGPLLAENIRRTLSSSRPRRTYRGIGMDFYLLNTCRGEAILSYYGLAIQARWLRRLKDWLDRRWVDRFSR
ncbi:hypothetical protein GRI69_06345 [Erythrobacter vulgaris]|uniref:FAD/NAD(P)-binding domain-containing protein n=1 Tax=Qipengyuania vulgaris TaxID=291985 RepID=A0A844XPF7_9SPHN|nr:FAD-dependent oxidoreductase [Qipengyuania vulgaris]MXO47871.1 hypothetical protein [Qipengyuania vulgaris]